MKAVFLIHAALLPGLVLAVSAEEVMERWSCHDRFAPEKALIHLTRGGEAGEITVAGVTRQAQFSVEGVNRRWDFVLGEDMRYEYALVIEPNGDGAYYDFTADGRAKPSQQYKCTLE